MKEKIGWITAALALCYWIIESYMDTLVMEHGFVQRLLAPDLNELWMRLVIVTLIASFGFYAQFTYTKLRLSENRLMRMNACFLDFGPDPVDNINRLTTLCGELLGSSAAFYNRLDQDLLSSWGLWCPSGAMPHEDVPQGHICRDLIVEGREDVTVIRDLQATPYATRETCIIPCGLSTYMGKTVSLGGEVVGSLCAMFKEDYNPSADDKRLMGIIASAVGVEEVRRRAQIALRESEEQLRHLSSELLTAQEKERKRLARQLHDSVGQSLSALKFGIEETLESLHDGVGEEKIGPLKSSVPLIRQIVNEIRQIQRDLYPATLEDLGIIATINSFCKQFRGIYRNIRVETRLQINETEAPKSLKPVIYRILQEAMNNIAKHSRSEFAFVCLRKEDNSLKLIIQDDGRGFDSTRHDSPLFKKGLGLASMRERAELSGGKFALESQQGFGTRIEVSWPTEEIDLSRQ